MSINESVLLVAIGGLMVVLILRLIVRRNLERQAVEEAARLEVERLAAEAAVRLEAERLAVEAANRLEAERLAVEAANRLEAERLAAEAAALTAKATIKIPEETVVMLADDSKVVRIKTGRLLSAHNYQVLTAEDGLDALRQIESAIPDLLITDVDMPGMGGLELTRHLRSQDRTCHVPIIMITSDNDRLRGEAMESGVDVVLGKPYPEEQLIACIQELVAGRRGS